MVDNFCFQSLYLVMLLRMATNVYHLLFAQQCLNPPKHIISQLYFIISDSHGAGTFNVITSF